MSEDAKHDLARWQPVATVRKWNSDEERESGAEPYETLVIEGNVLLNAGGTLILNRLINSGTAFSASVGRIGVGDSSTAAVASQTDLQAATNKQWVLVDSAPSVSGQTITFVATFTSALANFAWNEWAIDQGTSNGTTVVATCLDRKVASMGTKASGASWTLTVQISIS